MYWCCAQVEPRRERLASHCLGLAGYEIYQPLLREQRRSHGRKITVAPPLFPGYLFVWVVRGWWDARWSPGVVRLIMDGLLPARVPDAVIAEIRGRERNGLVELPKLRGRTPRTRARVISGPLREQIGIWDPGGSGEHRFQSFADDELSLRWPQLHRAASTEHAAVDLAGVRSEANALDAGHHIGGRVAHQREQARM